MINPVEVFSSSGGAWRPVMRNGQPITFTSIKEAEQFISDYRYSSTFGHLQWKITLKNKEVVIL